MARKQTRSTLHLQMGQETIYLLLTIALFAAVVMAVNAARESRPREDPPIITLTEAEGFYFATGSPAINPSFRERLSNAVRPRLEEIGRRYDATIIEVIGHTDEVPLRHRPGRSNLDRVLVPWFLGEAAPEPLAQDNVGLGMARAVAVARALRDSGLGRDYVVIPLSAGAFVRTDETVTDGRDVRDSEERRRIEIRMRRGTRPRP